jgi:hypothetical protein
MIKKILLILIIILIYSSCHKEKKLDTELKNDMSYDIMGPEICT